MRKKNQGGSLFQKAATKIHTIRSWVIGISIFLILVYGYIFLWPVVPNQSNTHDAAIYKVKITPQSSLASIAQQLQNQGLSTHTLPLQISAKALLVGSKLKPGTYL